MESVTIINVHPVVWIVRQLALKRRTVCAGHNVEAHHRDVANHRQKPDDSAPNFDALRCFRAAGSVGVNYARNVWHHPLLVLQAEQDFLIIDRAGPDGEDKAANLQEYWLDVPVALIVAA